MRLISLKNDTWLVMLRFPMSRVMLNVFPTHARGFQGWTWLWVAAIKLWIISSCGCAVTVETEWDGGLWWSEQASLLLCANCWGRGNENVLPGLIWILLKCMLTGFVQENKYMYCTCTRNVHVHVYYRMYKMQPTYCNEAVLIISVKGTSTYQF